MARVRLSEPCILNDIRYEVGEVVEVDDHIAELNAGWMAPTTDQVTQVASHPKASESAAKEAAKAEKEAPKAETVAAQGDGK